MPTPCGNAGSFGAPAATRPPSAPQQFRPPNTGGGYRGPPSSRVGATGGELVTIVVFGLKEKGLQPGDLETFFKERPGFESLQMNDRIDGMFVRFSSGAFAEQAMNEANTQQVGAEWARRNLDDDRSGQAMQAMPTAALPGGYGGAPAAYGAAYGAGAAYAGPPS